jgi:nucleotide-binding universal stress UspA family protein
MDVQKILVPIDYSSDSQQALQWGASLAGKYGARLLLLHVSPKAAEQVFPEGAGFVSLTSSFGEGMAVGSQPFWRQPIIVDLVDKAVTVHVLGQVMQRGTEVPGECQVWEARREQVRPAALPHTQPLGSRGQGGVAACV